MTDTGTGGHQKGRIAVNDSCLRPTLDHLLPDRDYRPAWEADPALNRFVDRFIRERGPQLQRFASIVDEDKYWGSDWSQGDEEELSDSPIFDIDSRHTVREARASARWRWVEELACKAAKVWLLAGPGLMDEWFEDEGSCWDGEEMPWGVRTPTLLDVMGRFLIRSILRWIDFEERRATALVSFTLDRIRESGIAQTAAGILAVLLAALVRLSDSVFASFDRALDLVLPRVIAPGGQTARFAPLT